MPPKKTPAYFNRELSWLEFNQRVFEEARDSAQPALERLKFLAITASNLDEFFMVRVGGLHMARKEGRRKRDPSGLTPLDQLRSINERAHRMMQELHDCFIGEVLPALDAGGVLHLDLEGLGQEQAAFLSERFREELMPVITPMAVGPGIRFPPLAGLSLHLIARLQATKPAATEDRYAVVPLGRAGPRIVPVQSGEGFAYVLLEEVVRHHLADWFPGYEVQECAVFRITRNADITVREEEAPDLLVGMEDVLEARKTGDCIRLEVEQDISAGLLKFLCSQVSAAPGNVYRIDGPLNLGSFMSLACMDGFDELRMDAWPPQPSPDVMPGEPMFDQVARQDLLLYHPYETFDPVVRFIEEAAADPDTIAVKMVLYRTSSDSAVISALKRAADNGVNVTVLMELKARFDEARNIDWARDLEQHGAHVVYGVKGFKTHAKICMVVRREIHGIVRYCHFGTGNYNESTARLYGDISYLTCNPDLGADASAFFNALCGYAQPRQFSLISMAPINMRSRLLELIDFEIEKAKKDKKALIRAKMNSLVDITLIDRLREAARAGVVIQLNVRGICCLKPARNITVTSIVDRYLEHARIIHFHHGGKPRVYISSADWMPRNLDKRLELLVPVDDRACRDRLIDILNTHLSDNQSSWILQPDGSHRRTGSFGGRTLRSQQVLYRQACKAIETAKHHRPTRFEPHRPKTKEP
jgi:polyphosphate kinase